jgi:excinuclease ABC subunit C
MDPREELRHKVSQLPLTPGVYLYKDAHGKIIYVGKAKNLRSRVRSYFNEDRLADAKTDTLISEARDVDIIRVDNNKEALALENKRRKHILWPVFPGQSGASPCSLHPPFF